jgi:hypothetical protein
MNVKFLRKFGLTLALVLAPASLALAGEASISSIRRATVSYRHLEVAEAKGYAQFLECMSSPNAGAMGVHYVNGALLEDGEIDPLQPEALLYEPQLDGSLRLVGVEYLVFVDAWDAKHTAPPFMLGQVFRPVDDPSLGVPPFYALHVWAWKTNPDGVFADWNPRVNCSPPQDSEYPADVDLCSYHVTVGKRTRPC